MRRLHALSSLLFAGLLSAALPAAASVIVLDFEGAGDQAQLLNFYNGGTDSQGNTGTDYGIQFSPDALSIIDSDAGGTGNIANEPSPNTVMFFLSGSAILNAPAGFDTGFSFYYSSSTAASVNVYDGLNATGNLLGSIGLAAQYSDNCTGDPTGVFCNWTPVGVSFAGIAKSIDFGGTVNQTAYDNVTFGSATPNHDVPEPPVLTLLGLGLAMIGFLYRKGAVRKA